jgi:asparagine N-glycosylation enzyme membrane subunit Stt3
MNKLLLFKKKIYIYAIICAIIFEVISMIILGPNIQFAYGLMMGTLVAIANFSLMALLFEKMLVEKRIGISIAGYIIRLGLCAAVILVALKIDIKCAAGALLGFITVKIAIFYLHGIKNKLQK